MSAPLQSTASAVHQFITGPIAPKRKATSMNVRSVDYLAMVSMKRKQSGYWFCLSDGRMRRLLARDIDTRRPVYLRVGRETEREFRPAFFIERLSFDDGVGVPGAKYYAPLLFLDSISPEYVMYYEFPWRPMSHLARMLNAAKDAQDFRSTRWRQP